MADFKYMTINQVVEDPKYPFTKGQLRDYLGRRQRNGLEKSISQVGRTIVIRSDLFDEWIESTKGK